MILVVRHGPGPERGRDKPYLQPVLDELAEREPELHRELGFWETGSPIPKLGGVSAVVYWLADPLREKYPPCFAEAMEIDGEAQARGLARVNPPETLSNSRKSVQARIWSESGLRAPPQIAYTDRSELLETLGAQTFPVIVRSESDHAQHRMGTYASRLEIEGVRDARLPYPGVLAQLIDTRESFRERDPGSVFARFHHRARAIVLGDEVLPIELFFSRSPIVSSQSSTFRRYSKAFPKRFPRLAEWARGERGCQAADVHYAREGDGCAAKILHASHALGLDWSAIDYAIDADGEAIFWEANPYFRLPAAHRWYLAGPRESHARLQRFTLALGRWLRELAGGAPGNR